MINTLKSTLDGLPARATCFTRSSNGRQRIKYAIASRSSSRAHGISVRGSWFVFLLDGCDVRAEVPFNRLMFSACRASFGLGR